MHPLEPLAPDRPAGSRRRGARVLDLDCVIGTRPEAIKMAPVVHALARDARCAPRVISTGQHRELLADLLPVLGLNVDLNLDLMVPGQSAAYTVGRAVAELSAYWRVHRPDAVLVQGDTGTAFGAALAAYYERIPVGHVEAGLRTFDRTQPFPEETNRVLISRVASLHFCPTAANRKNLLDEGVPPEQIFVTGNTGIDSFLRFWRRANGDGRKPNSARRTILVTVHRRENADGPFGEICRALARIPTRELGARVVFPVHPNPALRETARRHLTGVEDVALIDPLRYDRFVAMMAESALVVTDSGGIQEEACAMGKPTLVLRNLTERQEGVVSGATRVIGTRAEDIVREVTRLLSDRAALRALARSTPCFGDGRAAERIVGAVRHVFLNGKRPLDFDLVLARRGAARGNGHGARGTGRRTAAVPAPIPH